MITPTSPHFSLPTHDAILKLMEEGLDQWEAKQLAEEWLLLKRTGGLSKTEAHQHLSQQGLNELDIRQRCSDDRYDTMYFTFPSLYPFSSIMLVSDLRSQGMEITINAHNLLSLNCLAEKIAPKGKPLLQGRSTHHDKMSGYNQIRRLHSLPLFLNDADDLMDIILTHIIHQLEAMPLLDGSLPTLQAFKQQAFHFLNKYKSDRVFGFPAGNCYFRHPIEKPTLSPTVPFLTEAHPLRQLKTALMNRDTALVPTLLRNHTLSNQLINGLSPILFILPKNDDKETATPDALLFLLKLLLAFNAPISQGFNCETALAELIYLAMPPSNSMLQPRKMLTLMLMTELLIRADNAATACYFAQHDREHPFAKCVLQGQAGVFRSRKFNGLELSVTPSPMVQYYFHPFTINMPATYQLRIDGALRYHVHTLKIADFLKSAYLYRYVLHLFSQQANWKQHLADKEAYFKSCILAPLQGESYIDLIFETNRLVGFNIAELITLKQGDKREQLHRCALAVNTTPYPILFWIVHLRGFLPALMQLPVTLRTLFECASTDSMVSAIAFDFYPKSLKSLASFSKMIQAVYPKEDIHYDPEHCVFYLKDPLANPILRKTNTSLLTPKQISAEIFHQLKLFKPGHSTIVCYKNNRKNFSLFSREAKQSGVNLSLGHSVRSRVDAKL